MKFGVLFAAVGAALSLPGLVLASDPDLSLPASITPEESEYRFNDFFPRQSFFGKRARGWAWSHDDRYLAFLWNEYEETGYDLWLFDTESGDSARLTSMDVMEAFDPDIPEMKEQHEERLEEQEKIEEMSEMEYREHLEEKRDSDEERKPAYPGISEVEWANNGHQMLFTYRGDIYSWEVGEEKPERMTFTRDWETDPQYTQDDTGFFFQRGDGVYRMQFDSPHVRQLNPELPHNMRMGGYDISPDETAMMIRSYRQVQGSRQVDYIVYRDRFADARSTNRDVASDPYKGEAYMFLVDLTVPENEKNEPWEVWKSEAGPETYVVGYHSEPWSPDSKKFAFARWTRSDRKLEVVIADRENEELEVVHEATTFGEKEIASFVRPFFTPDGSKLVATLESSGFRNAYLIDPLTKGATSLTEGPYERYPLELSKDGKTLYLRGDGDLPSRSNVYALDMETREERQIGRTLGRYRDPLISETQSKVAYNFINWDTRPELMIMNTNGGGETMITESHPDGFEKVSQIKPELFQYENRQGHTIHGYMIAPPDHKPEDKRPLLIYMYAGPLGEGHSVEDGAFGSTGYFFFQYLALEHGYIGVVIDPRGQSGYGAAHGNAHYNDPGRPATEDLQDGVNWLVENYGVDPERVGLTGWSFGGYQTQHAMYTAPETFKLGMAGAGPTEWQNYNRWYADGTIGPIEPGKPEQLDKFSLTHIAKNLEGPLMLIHGVEDLNVLYQDSVAVYREILRHGKGSLVEFVIDPTGGHGLGGDINRRDSHTIYLAFLLKHFGSYEPEALD